MREYTADDLGNAALGTFLATLIIVMLFVLFVIAPNAYYAGQMDMLEGKAYYQKINGLDGNTYYQQVNLYEVSCSPVEK